jgi:hypothetical protein
VAAEPADFCLPLDPSAALTASDETATEPRERDDRQDNEYDKLDSNIGPLLKAKVLKHISVLSPLPPSERLPRYMETRSSADWRLHPRLGHWLLFNVTAVVLMVTSLPLAGIIVPKFQNIWTLHKGDAHARTEIYRA